jgi:ribosome biogenesis protein MAK21
MTVKKEEVNSKKNKMSDKKKSKNSTKKDSSSSSGAMKSRLLGALLTGVNRAHPYLPKKDEAMEQHIDALYRISHTAPPSASTQALMLLFQLAVGQVESNATTIITASDKKQDDNTVTTRKDRFYRALYSKLSDGEMFTGRQLTLFFNLLYKAMKYDTSPERISAFIKRLLHSVLHLSSSIVCGSLFLLSEIVRCHPELRYEVDTTTVASSGAVVTFDPTKREPRAAYSSSSKTASTKDLWELSLLAHHFHPSVTRFVAGSEGDIAYQGDPLKDFALQPFLDKFAFRNPKSIDKLTKQLKRGVSVAERKSGLSGVSALLPMNDPSYLESKNVSEEDSFFHKFFVERARRDGIKGIVRGSASNKDKDDSDLEDEALDAAEADELIDNFDGDTDSEEEAFVNQLAEKLMESSGNGKVNFDDEDPDMDGWSDYDDDEGEENVDDDDDDDSATPGIHDNEDSFMDDASSDDNDDGEAFDALGSGDDSDSGDDVDGEMPREAGSDDEFDLEEKPVSNDVKKQGKRKNPTSIYADAEEYEKQLEEEMRNQSHHDDEDSDSSSSEEKVKSNRKKKPKKR